VPDTTKTAVVSFNDGPDEYVLVLAGKSVCDAAHNALERFNSDCWKGPVPKSATMLYVSQVGSSRQYCVTVEKVRQLLGSDQLVDDHG
jgi:hypothetical protein